MSSIIRLSVLREADLFLAESEVGTLYQKETMLARREGRTSRYPSLFTSDEERRAQIAVLEQEYRAKGVAFR